MNVLSTMEVVNKHVSMMWVLTTVTVDMDIILTWTITLVRVGYISNYWLRSHAFSPVIFIYTVTYMIGPSMLNHLASYYSHE